MKYRVDLSFVGRHIVYPHTVKKHISLIRSFKTADDPERGCLSATGRTQQGDKFLVMDIQVDAGEYALAIEGFTDGP